MLLLTGCSYGARQGTAVGFDQSATVGTTPDGSFETDPDVRIVTLDNGLTVYLRHNETPGRNAELRLVVNAGSVDEAPDQVGAAHFLEHMMFNGTTTWPGNALIDQLREFGMEFGADVNAYTSYDETVFELAVPTEPGGADSDAPIGIGLDILSEWLSAATLDAVEVDAEVGVVLDEWRGDQSFSGRLGDAVANVYLAQSAYDDHSPIGTADAIQSMTSQKLRAFYDRWYRPDNSAVVVVGDFDVDDVEQLVRTEFEGLTPRADAPTRADRALQPLDQPSAVVFTDPDTSVAEVELTLPQPWKGATTLPQLRTAVVDDLAFEMIVNRLSDDVSRGQAPFSEAYRSDNGMVRDLDAPSVVLTTQPDEADAAIDALLIEFERADRFGFNAGEFQRAMNTFRSDVVARYDARDSISDLDYAEQYVQHFLVGSPLLEPFTQRTVLTDLYDSITTDDVGAAFSDRYHSSGSHLLVVAPDTLADTLPTVQALVDRLAARSSLVIEPREDTAAVEGELMARPDPVPESSADEMTDDPYSFIDPTLLTFPNGARVVLNPTDIAADSVVLAASSPGGLSLVPDADVPEALRAVEVVTSSGLGTLDPVQLDTLLSAGSVEVYPALEATTESFSGTSTTHDVETMLQVIATYLQQPRFDQAALDSTIDSWRPYVDDPNGDPDLAVFAKYSELRYAGEPRYAAMPTAADLDALDLATVERVWRDRFSSPGDWVFAISGDFDLDEMTDLVRRYIGSLPTNSRPPEVARDIQPPPPDGIADADVRVGTGQKATLTRLYEAPIDLADLGGELVLADIVSGVISNRLTDRVREALGSSYSPYGSASVYTDPDLLVETYVEATGDPDQIDELTRVLNAELVDLSANGPTSSEFDDAKAAVEQSYDLFDDDTLTQLLIAAVIDDAALDEFIRRRDTLAETDLADVRSALERSLPVDHYIQLRLLPG